MGLFSNIKRALSPKPRRIPPARIVKSIAPKRNPFGVIDEHDLGRYVNSHKAFDVLHNMPGSGGCR